MLLDYFPQVEFLGGDQYSTCLCMNFTTVTQFYFFFLGLTTRSLANVTQLYMKKRINNGKIKINRRQFLGYLSIK